MKNSSKNKKKKEDASFDENNNDIVTLQRDELALEQHPPAIDDQTKPYQNKSFAPYLDVENDHKNRPASYRIFELKKLAALNKLSLLRENMIKKEAGLKIFKYAPPSHLQLENKLWQTSLNDAFSQGVVNSDSNMYIASISETADIIKYPHQITKTLLQAALLQEMDVVIFQDKEVFIMNPAVVVDIKQMGSNNNYDDGDVNSLNVGLFDNYVGLAQHSFPGSSGFMGGAGGAGMIDSGHSFQL